MSAVRGTNTLFKEFFEAEQPIKVAPKGIIQSTNASRRNECLVDRYFFYGKYYGLSYNRILDELEKEFFISKGTIPDIISDNIDQLRSIKKVAPVRADLKKKWPHLDWNPTLLFATD
jgi:hypothetical protein